MASNGINRRELLSGLGIGAVAGTLPASSPARAASVVRSDKPHIKLAGYDYDRVQGLVDGRVQVEGCTVQFDRANIYELNNNAMGGAQKWEVQEIGLHPYMLAYANDKFRDYTLIPVFPLRVFRHKSVFIRTDRGIEKPEDLRGKTIATPGYSQSSPVWIRGFLQHEYGVAPADMQWVLTASSDKGKPTKNESLLPDGVSISKGPEGKDESDLLAEGNADAIIAAIEPRVYLEGHPKVARLFPDSRKTERDYFAKTGIFPIMHVVAVRMDVVEKHPELPKALFKAYSQAKTLMYQFMDKMAWAKISLPWLVQDLADVRELMGRNYWPYGIAPNRKTLEALFQYSHEQGLAKRELAIEELFHPSSLALLEDQL